MRLAMSLAVFVAFSAPASAAWVQCHASGADTAGALFATSTAVDVGAVPGPRLDRLGARIAAAVARLDPDARNVTAACATFDDSASASAAYSRMLAATARRLGWEHVMIVRPDEWLGENEIVTDPSRP